MLRGRSFASASVEATDAPRNSRGPEGLLLGTPPSLVAEGSQLRARKRSEMAKRIAKAKRTRPKALERREESAGNSRPMGGEEAARYGEETYDEVAPMTPSMRQRRP